MTTKKGGTTMLRLAWVLKEFKKEVVLGPLFKLIEAIFELLVPLVMAHIIDVGVAQRDLNTIFSYGALILLFAMGGIASSCVCQVFAARCCQSVGTVLRREVYRKINTFSIREMHHFTSASLINRLTSDVNQVQQAVAMLIRLAVRAPFLVIGSLVMAMMIDRQLALIFLGVMAVITITLLGLMKLSGSRFRAVQQKLDQISHITAETLEGQRVIRAFSCQQKEQQRFDNAADESSRAMERVGRISGLFHPATQIITNFAIVVILYCGALEVRIGQLSQGNLIALVNYMTQMYLALVVVANLFTLFTRASASARRIDEVLQQPLTMKEKRPTEAVKEEPLLVVKQVSVSYNRKENALSQISLSLGAGQTLGVIGATGSGKSTLALLLMRMMDPDAGQIRFAGRPLDSFSLNEIRDQIRLVPQQAVLFSGTIRENLMWGNPQAQQDQLIRALQIAQAYDFVMALGKGLDSEVSQGGKNFSGGQRQRLCIARALTGHPQILILDDSTSALDYRTEALLRDALRQQTCARATIMISQRASSLRGADQILVLDHGRQVGLGTHHQLLEQCPVYRQIVQSQTGEGSR